MKYNVGDIIPFEQIEEARDYVNSVQGNYYLDDYKKDGEGRMMLIVKQLPAPSLEEVKAEKVAEMKVERDRIQELPIEYNGKSFDYNKESLQKLNEAKDCLEGTEDMQIWICADNSLTYLNYNDIMAIKRLGKERSNNVHIQYAKLKYLIEIVKTVEEVEAITFETDTSDIPLEV